MIPKLVVNSSLQEQMAEAVESARKEYGFDKNYIVVLGDDGNQYANIVDRIYRDGFLSNSVFYPFVAFKRVDEINAQKIKEGEKNKKEVFS